MSDDYDKWYAEWVRSWKENTNEEEPTNIYKFSSQQNNRNTRSYTYNWYDNSQNKNYKVKLDQPVSESFIDKVETALAKVNIALDNLLNYLHDKKNN